MYHDMISKTGGIWLEKSEFHFGYRSIKTVLACAITLMLSYFLQRGSGFYAANAAIVCMQPTRRKTVSVGLDRLLGTAIGGMFGFLILWIAKDMHDYHTRMYLVLIPLFLTVVIGFCALIRQYDAIVMSSLVFLSIATTMDMGVSNLDEYVFGRMLDTSIGIIVAMLINRYVFPMPVDHAPAADKQ